ncbi:MAG: 2-oxo acid dehydrogenase subunit E2 [Planctomycetes bacterium]|nr:2-oxo acid dehydrogenase subunit E2 [Planctomycetota bacterium]
MPKDFKLPDLGEGVKEGQIVRLLVAEGDLIVEDQPLMEVETDKASVEIPSPYAGIVQKLHVAEQQIVNVGEVLVTIEESGSMPTSAAKTSQASKQQAISSTSSAQKAGALIAATAISKPGRTKPASPAVRKLARTLGVDINTIEGSGPGGRVLRSDLDKATASPSLPTPTVSVTSVGVPVAKPSRSKLPTMAMQPMPEPPGTSDKDQYGPITRQPLSQARKTIAANMTKSCQTIPHVTDTDEADVTLLDELRRTHDSLESSVGKLTLLPFVLCAAAMALRRHPIFNASFDDQAGEIIYKRYINIAVGVHTKRGLVAPVIRDTDQMGIAQINAALHEITEKARAASFAVNDLRGGTFTISNAGAMGGSRFSTPIITQPQVAVMALGRTKWRAWVVDGKVLPRLIMPISISFDHRIIDGGSEVAFQQDIISALENPAQLLL